MAWFRKKKKTTEEAAEEQARKTFEEGLFSVRDLIAPAALALSASHLQLNDRYVRTLFVLTYPQYIDTNWLTPIINFDTSFDISMHIYPVDSTNIMKLLRRKVTEMESSLRLNAERGAIRDPELEIAYQDAEELRDGLQRGLEKFFHYALYFTIYAKNMEDLDAATDRIETALGGQLVYTKQALMQMQAGFNSTLPLGDDELKIVRNMTSSSLSTTFPFVSPDLTTNEGVLYGINRHNNSLILFDRFKLENANMVVFAKSGAGKSYAVKLEILRSMMQGVDVIVIDPEDEYHTLAKAVGGSYLPISLNSDKRINPFDLPTLGPETDGETNLRSAIIALLGLMNLMLGQLTPEEDALMDQAIREAYALRDITENVASQKNPAPTMQDLSQVLSNIEGAKSLAQRLEKYVSGTFSGIFNKPTNFGLDRGLVVFNIRDLEESLRPIAMYIVLNYIWNKIRFEKRKRLLIIDESWVMMQYEDSAKFLYSIAKRARKYWLGLTTITQDVEDFLNSDYGKAVVSNSSLQLLFRQSPASIDIVADTFNLTEGEKFLLLESAVGEGLFFAGTNHAAIKVVASYIEDKIATSDPEQLAQLASLSKIE
ncbi:conjugal transfer protein TraC [candidate division Kazan bacterium RBG_13_50_9]|uniref:Conjugal transfer protein TraC n=1 Tax=candidate division Kazan bacterium RBG_13_50_9 TaxID=1798535 RepID=A0A1F4NSM1_UNCK3|nr:MAG: conjugal transfer protein TraC [candidate division Kazan bacterium RBG_13_50_9]